MQETLAYMKFTGKLRPSQEASSTVIRERLAAGERRLLVVAPPGSGKTVLGLYVWSELVRKAAVVLSPNSAIQAQWIARAREQVDVGGRDAAFGADGKLPSALTSITYQSVTMPKRKDATLDESATELWLQSILAAGEAESEEQAQAWIADLKASNPDYHEQREAFYRKKARGELVSEGDALSVLHRSARETLESLKNAGVGLIILDECHHLLDHWGQVIDEITGVLDNPIVLGLTATPPDPLDVDPEAFARYQDFLGEIDYEVPVPALVRDGNLAPYQDLAWFVRPSPEELEYIAGVDRDFAALLEELARGPDGEKDGRIPGLDPWLQDTLANFRLPGRDAGDWSAFTRRDPTLADHGRVYLASKAIPMPPGVPAPEPQLLAQGLTGASLLLPLLDRYIRHGLIRSKSKADHELAEEAKGRLRLYGVQVTESGMRSCASPISRVLAYASAKREALLQILQAEHAALGDAIRAVVVTDFEISASTTLVEGILDEEAGGAVAVYRTLVNQEAGDRLDPILMTGSTVLVDDDLVARLRPRMEQWISDRGLDITLKDLPHGPYHQIVGTGPDWVTRNYTVMLTELFQEGVTKCIVGTRGLLGEGWDASRINVLVDLTTVTTSMSINQLRGRSFRLDKHWPQKVANNWDVVCLAEEFAKGFDDYERFKRKHANLFGVCDDGAIEKGVGHVHPSFTDNGPELLAETMHAVNEEMLAKAVNRERARDLWRIGEPFKQAPKEAIEASMGEEFAGGFPAIAGAPRVAWNTSALLVTMGKVVAQTMLELGHLDRPAKVAGGARGGAWSRLFLENATAEQSALFVESMQQLLAPLENPRYVIPRKVRHFDTRYRETLLSRLLPFAFRPKEITTTRDELVMWHEVPKLFSKNKADAEVFQRHWNAQVSPGGVVYAHAEEGRSTVDVARAEGQVPQGRFHEKTIFA